MQRIAGTLQTACPMKITRGRVLLVCSILALAGAAGLFFRLRSAPQVTYETVPVSRGTIAPYVIASGTVNPVTTIQVGTYVSGVIQELPCDFNTRVRKGQLCAKIDPRPYQTIVNQDVADLEAAQAQLLKDQANNELARITYERTKELLELDSTSKEAFDTANSAYQQGRSQIAVDKAVVAQRKAALEAARVNLGYTDIVSPVDGTVVSRNVTQGQTVAASFQTPTLFVIATDLTQMQVDTSVSESDIGEVAAGNEASFTVEAYPNRVFRGRVVQVRQAPQTVQNVVTYDVVVEAPNPELLLKPGMTAAARITTHRREDVLLVPAQALRYSPSPSPQPGGNRADTHVWLLRNGVPTAVAFQAGLNDGNSVEILAGELTPGDPVIISQHSSGDARVSQGPGQMVPRVPRL